MKRTITYFIGIILLLASCGKKQDIPVYRDKTAKTEVRVKDLLSRMTMEEKVAQLTMKTFREKYEKDVNGFIKESILDTIFKGLSYGFCESSRIDDPGVVNASVHNYLVTKTRLGIPPIRTAECLHGVYLSGTTIFPQSINLGSTWNPELVKEMAEVIAAEGSALGVDQALSPLFDIAREPRWGRVEECYGEDPYLVARMGIAFVTGMQGEPAVTKDSIDRKHIMCTAKHFAAYSIPTAGINIAPTEIGERMLRSSHLYPFAKAVQEANVYSVMPSYAEIDGIPVHVSNFMLRDILRKEWGFKGFVISDFGAVKMNYTHHHTARDLSEAALQSILAGVDVEAPRPETYWNLVKLVENKKLDIKVIDELVCNVLRAKFKKGLFDKGLEVPVNAEKIKEIARQPEAIELSERLAEESIILLKNDKNLLPLDPSKLKSIAVVGPNAEIVQFGDYCFLANSKGVTVLEGITNYVGDKVKINFAHGCGLTSLDKTYINEVVEAAKKSDVVVVVVGSSSSLQEGVGWGEDKGSMPVSCGEGHDCTSLDLPGVQHDLIKAVCSTGKPVVMVMLHGRPFSINWEKENVPAILAAWYPGEEGGQAIANILFGDVSPSGRLTVSIPQSVGHIPNNYDYKPSARGYYHNPGTNENPGNDYVFSTPDPLYCFGYGLSYTTFEFSDMQISKSEFSPDEDINIKIKVKNTGQRKGKEVVQLYINDRVSSVTTPVKELKGFDKIELSPGQEKVVGFVLKTGELKLWNREMKYVLEPGEFEIMIGASSDDIRSQKTITII